VRPKTIVYFERIMFGILLLGTLQLLAIAPVATWYILILIFSLLVVTLTLLVSRRRSKVAMWILIAWFVLNVTNAIWLILLESNIIVATVSIGAEARIRILLQGTGQAAALGLLFTRSARRWMNREDEKNERLREVFH
jgi:hypothetical protein